MRKLILVAAAIIGLGIAQPHDAKAIPITGVINFAGQQTYDSATNAVTFGGAIVTSATGSFATAGFNIFPTLANFTSPFDLDVYPQTLYTSTSFLLKQASFLATSLLSESVTNLGPFLNGTVELGGTAKLTGYDDTMALFDLTFNQTDGTVLGSFSSIQVEVSEPASIALLGIGLIAMGFTIRRNQRHANNNSKSLAAA